MQCKGLYLLVVSLASPALAVDLLVGDRSGVIDKVQRFDAMTGAFLNDFANSASDLDAPRGITLGPDGRVYVSSFNNDRIIRYDAITGAKIDTYVTAGSGGLDGPQGLAFSPHDGNLYVSSRNTNSVKRYQGPSGASPGAYIDDFVTTESGGLGQPTGLVFGKDVWPADNPNLAPHLDGKGELLVCSFTTNSVKWYNGITGAYIKDFISAGYNGLQTPADIIFDPGPLGDADLLVSSYGGNAVMRFSGTCSTSDECGAWGFVYTSGADLAQPYGLAYGPDTSGDSVPELYVANVGSNTVMRFRGPRGNGSGQYINTLINTGLSQPGPLLVSCDGQPPAVLADVANGRGLAGLGSPSMHTLRVTGQNLGSLTGLKLTRSRHSAQQITAASFQVIDSSTIEATFDLADAEGGRYDVVAIDPCALANPVKEGFLVYLPELTNGGFEEGIAPDPTTGNICEDPNAHGQRPKPKHWDEAKMQIGQHNFFRDGKIWQPCVSNPNPPPEKIVGGRTGEHYGSSMANNSDQAEISVFQTIAAPFADQNGMTTELTQVRVDLAIRSFDRTSTAFIRLHDGSEDDPVIAELEVANTDNPPYNTEGLVSDSGLHADVPLGHFYTSDPPLLTIELVLHAALDDQCALGECPGVSDQIARGEKAVHYDNVLIGPYVPPGCSDGRVVWADDNQDGSVDSTDFAVLQRCLTTGAPAATLSSQCRCFDRDNDGQVVEFDVVEFVNCATGPAVPWSNLDVPLCIP